MSVLEALQPNHDVVLLTTSDVSDLSSHNEYYGTDVGDIETVTMDFFGIELAKLMKNLNNSEFGKLNYLTSIASQAMYHRCCRRAVPNVDLFISTWDEVSIEYPSILYIHAPTRYNHLMPDDGLDYPQPLPWFIERYRSVLRRFAGFDPKQIITATMFANSKWTAARAEEAYDVQPRVLYPPVNTEPLTSGMPWNEREDGFIFLSRIHPCKNIVWLIDILREVRDRGNDIHFHIIGPKDPDNPEYYNEVRREVSNHGFVSLEGPMYGEELREMLKSHKYGINGAMREQFGISIAEMVASGMIPFVPRGGGQTEVVNDLPEVVFNSSSEAVRKIDNMYDSDTLPSTTRQNLPDINSMFGRSEFQSIILESVGNILQRDN